MKTKTKCLLKWATFKLIYKVESEWAPKQMNKVNKIKKWQCDTKLKLKQFSNKQIYKVASR